MWGEPMPDKKTDTATLMERLLKTASLNRYLTRHDEDINNFPAFSEYIGSLCKEKDMTAESVIKKSQIERTYGYRFFNGTRTPSRDKVLQLAVGLGLELHEAQKLLAVARKSPLHPKVKRDAAIVFALKKGFDMAEAQSLLQELGCSVLGRDKCE